MTLIKAKDVLLAWLSEVDRAGAGYANPEVEVTYADEYVGDAPTWADDDDGGGGSGAWVNDPDDGAAASAAFEKPTRAEEKESGLEIITREEWEDRLRREGKSKQDTAVPDNVFVVGKPTED